MKIRIKKYHGEYEISILYGEEIMYTWCVVMDNDGEYLSNQFPQTPETPEIYE